ncbi:lipase member H isoform X5 [Nerophis ophidion]|uniref:lipase member H isoform X5 n=1 Tax=Nerophis ophidion TaxID=159077 RepID=UPI002ADFF2EA|nr:lipase member H isoform X5 [Nerophis ophidion]
MSLWRYLTLLLATAVYICKAEKCDHRVDLQLGHAIIGTTLRMKLLLFTRDTIHCGSLLSHSNLSANPNFNLSRPTTFVIHGYRPTGSPPNWADQITELLLARKDLNVIYVDWNYGAANLNYFKVVENTHKAAHNLTAFVKKMQEHGASLNDIHMIGISLGAHISGFVGANLNGSIGRITALDPAGPQFTGAPPEDRLDPTDALFVDALHTDIDALGYREALGHIDFYANGGTDQPGCPRTIFSGGSYFKCDHQRSVYLFFESLKHTCSSRAFPCASYRDFLDGYDIDKWKDVLLKMGQTKTFFFTNTKSPFCTKHPNLRSTQRLRCLPRLTQTSCQSKGCLSCSPPGTFSSPNTNCVFFGFASHIWNVTTGRYVAMTSSYQRTKRSPSLLFPAKSLTFEAK